MFEFIAKSTIWDSIDAGLLARIDQNISYQLKTAQDLAVLQALHTVEDKDIAEIGGGTSRVLRALSERNRCTNIEKFEGAANGPVGDVAIERVRNLHAFVGDFSPLIEDASFDIVFSISVVEHVRTEDLGRFADDVLRILKPGGMFLHAIDLYVADEPAPYFVDRYNRYLAWVSDHPRIEALKPGPPPPLRFSTAMASNPDNIMYQWRELAPDMHPIRKTAQNVSLMVGGRKKR